MTSAKQFFAQTAETASFAFREFFSPLLILVRCLRGLNVLPGLAQSTPDDQARNAKAILWERLAKGRDMLRASRAVGCRPAPP